MGKIDVKLQRLPGRKVPGITHTILSAYVGLPFGTPVRHPGGTLLIRGSISVWELFGLSKRPRSQSKMSSCLFFGAFKLNVGDRIEVEFDDVWYKATVHSEKPGGLKVVFTVDNTSTVVPPEEVESRIRKPEVTVDNKSTLAPVDKVEYRVGKPEDTIPTPTQVREADSAHLQDQKRARREGRVAKRDASSADRKGDDGSVSANIGELSSLDGKGSSLEETSSHEASESDLIFQTYTTTCNFCSDTDHKNAPLERGAGLSLPDIGPAIPGAGLNYGEPICDDAFERDGRSSDADHVEAVKCAEPAFFADDAISDEPIRAEEGHSANEAQHCDPAHGQGGVLRNATESRPSAARFYYHAEEGRAQSVFRDGKFLTRVLSVEL